MESQSVCHRVRCGIGIGLRYAFLSCYRTEVILETSEEIDNLSRSTHAESILEQHRRRFHAARGATELWQNRDKAFPHLHFGSGVEDNLRQSASHLQTIIGKLADLDLSAREWKSVGGPAPPWKTKVTPESETVRTTPKLWNVRRFPTRQGNHEIFEWHARYGAGGRIHVRFEPNSCEVEVGYIGPHLPLS